jgi:very-short-patch-repair endonuclease
MSFKKNFLDKLNIENIHSYYVKEIKAFYDFYLPKYNTIIEVDGDFYHCNPIKYPNGSICKTQEKNLIRDKEKNDWAQDNGFKLLRFWENDIKNNPQQIIEILKQELT